MQALARRHAVFAYAIDEHEAERFRLLVSLRFSVRARALAVRRGLDVANSTHQLGQLSGTERIVGKQRHAKKVTEARSRFQPRKSMAGQTFWGPPSCQSSSS